LGEFARCLFARPLVSRSLKSLPCDGVVTHHKRPQPGEYNGWPNSDELSVDPGIRPIRALGRVGCCEQNPGAQGWRQTDNRTDQNNPLAKLRVEAPATVVARRHGRPAVSISSRANGGLGEHRRHDTDGMRLEKIAASSASPPSRVNPSARNLRPAAAYPFRIALWFGTRTSECWNKELHTKVGWSPLDPLR
jgi:hypothetical protein